MTRASSNVLGASISTLLLSACAASHPAAAPPAAAARAEPAALVASVEPAIQRMIAPELGGTPLKILSVAGPVSGWLAVAVAPPYREFPTVVLFQATPDGSWSRVFEALTPGVQGQRSPLLDLHTTGRAFDMTVGGPVTPDTIAKVLPLSKKELVTVAHAYFFHHHQTGAESYFVDRTATYELAQRLFPGEYEQYPRDECTMFDVPALTRINLLTAQRRFFLTAQTDNGQTWVIGWDGVDARGLLTGKTVDAKRLEPR